jgi:Asp-tRNA(Asn)/Glu-tRNA(Gln) amidotransferase A subunit family amidase
MAITDRLPPEAPSFATLEQLTGALARRQISPVDLARQTLELIERLDSAYNCFAALDPDRVLAEARAVEESLMRGEQVGPLSGLPIAIKDLIAVKDYPTQFGSRIMAGNVIPEDAPAVERLRKAGAVILGKSTTSEFGCKAVGDSPLTGITRNPWNTDTTPGGSSCGAAALVAGGISPVAVGTDGGGSVRIPSALSGLFGIKGQFGRVPVYPTSATPTLAHVGPLTRTVRDAAIMMSIMSGFDRRDPFSVAGPVPDYLGACERPYGRLRIAWSPTMGYAEPLPEVLEICARAVDTLAQLGCEVDEVEQVMDRDPVDLWVAEFYAGVGTKLNGPLADRRAEIDPAVAEVLDQAVGQRMGDYYARVFDRYAFRDQMRRFFEPIDLLVTPCVPVPAFAAGADRPPSHQHRSIVSWVYYTYPFNLTGQPAASIPVGFTADGLPVGLQLVAKSHDEAIIFTAAAALEEALPWADARPPLPAG